MKGAERQKKEEIMGKEKAVVFWPKEDGRMQSALLGGSEDRYRTFQEAVRKFPDACSRARGYWYPGLQLATAVFRGRNMKRLTKILHLEIPHGVKQLRIPVAVQTNHALRETELWFPVQILNASIWDFHPELIMDFTAVGHEIAPQKILEEPAFAKK